MNEASIAQAVSQRLAIDLRRKYIENIMPFLLGKDEQDVARFLQKKPRATLREIGEGTGIASSTIHEIINRIDSRFTFRGVFELRRTRVRKKR